MNRRKRKQELFRYLQRLNRKINELQKSKKRVFNELAEIDAL